MININIDQLLQMLCVSHVSVLWRLTKDLACVGNQHASEKDAMIRSISNQDVNLSIADSKQGSLVPPSGQLIENEA
jgi:hypothetical protein